MKWSSWTSFLFIRFGHSMIQGFIQMWQTSGIGSRPVKTYELHNHYFNMERYREEDGEGMEQILMGLVTQKAQKVDQHATGEISNKLFPDAVTHIGNDCQCNTAHHFFMANYQSRIGLNCTKHSTRTGSRPPAIRMLLHQDCRRQIRLQFGMGRQARGHQRQEVGKVEHSLPFTMRHRLVHRWPRSKAPSWGDHRTNLLPYDWYVRVD